MTPRAPGIVVECGINYRTKAVGEIFVCDIDELIDGAANLSLPWTFDPEDYGLYCQLHDVSHFAVKVWRLGALFVARSRTPGDKADLDFAWDQFRH